MSPIAPIGAAAYLGGMGLNAWGQDQALDAMRDVWANNTAQQAGFDRQLDRRQQQALAELSPQGMLGLEQAAALNGKLSASARNAAAAMSARAGRRPGANVEGRAVAGQRAGGTLADLLRSGKLQALLAGMQGGQDHSREVSQSLGIDSRMIGNDARSYASLIPMQEQAAGMQGGWARQLGQLFQGLGQMGIMAGLSAPGAEVGQAPLWETGPAGGTEAMMGMSQGAVPYSPSVYSFMP